MNRDFYNTFSGNVPMYPYPTVQPNVIPMQGVGMQGANMQPMPYPAQGNLDKDISSLNNKVTNLERRVSNLENLVGSNFNNSNFQVL